MDLSISAYGGQTMTRKGMKKKRYKKKTNRNLSTTIITLMALSTLLLVTAGYLLLSKSDVDPNYLPEVTGRPSLKVEKEELDFGDVPLNETVYAAFKLTNVGDKTLKFTGTPYIELKDGC
jgi:hypothetical protein